MPAAVASVSKPGPGTLSNGAASASPAVLQSSALPATGASAARAVVVERRRRRDDLHVHLVGQRPAGGVVRLLGRPVRVLAQVGIVLDLEDLLRELRELLVHRDDPRAGGVALAVDRGGRGRAARRARR